MTKEELLEVIQFKDLEDRNKIKEYIRRVSLGALPPQGKHNGRLGNNQNKHCLSLLKMPGVGLSDSRS